MQKIVPHLWFDKEAKEAAQFYTSVFPDSRIENITTLQDTPSGDASVVTFNLSGYTFMAISAGPIFKINPSISFILNFDPSRDKNARESLDKAWEKLSQGGNVLMPIDEYSFSKRYGWIQDRYGVSWQLMLTNPTGEERPFIIPCLMFTGDYAGKAEEAIRFYTSIFKDAKIGDMHRYGEGREPDRPESLMFADFMLFDQWFGAMDSAKEHDFIFNEAVSLLVNCDTQEEIDHYWNKLSAVPESEQCGWLKDKFGVSWQISPTVLNEMMSNGTQEQVDRVTKAFLPMKKLNIAELEKAYKSEKAEFAGH